MKKFIIILNLTMTVFLGSCSKKEVFVNPQTISSPSKNPLSSARIRTFPLYWEGIHKDIMPTPSNLFIKTPWASGGTGGAVNIDKAILNDRSSKEGWVLLYNTFNTLSIPSVYYFMLYNRYRGIVRLYYYTCSCNGTGNISSRDIMHGLQTSGSNAPHSPLLNYAAQSIVDVNSNSTSFYMTDNKAVTPNAWYVFQYEVAYDRNIHTYNFTNFDFNWSAKGLQVTDVTLNGKASGSIDGKIAVKGGGINLSGTAITIATKGTVVQNGGDLTEGILDKLGIKDGIKKGISDGISGIVSNTLSSIFGIGKEDNAHLKVDIDLSLKGELSSSFLITPIRFATPGYNHSNTTGFEPNENAPMGIFYLEQRPTVEILEFPDEVNFRRFQANLISNSIKPIYNTAVIQDADIRLLRAEMLAQSSALLNGQGTVESTGGLSYIPGTSFNTLGGSPTVLGVRVVFEVAPKDGSPKVLIVKTFTPNIVRRRIR